MDGGVETSQLSFEGSDQEKRARSLNQKGVSCDHPEMADIMELNVKQTLTVEARGEKETDHLNNHDSNTRSAMEGVEKLDTSSSRDDQITNSNSTGLAEQDINNIKRTSEEGPQENSHVDQSRCKEEKRLVSRNFSA